ncbi:MAG: hypothetical protein ACXAB7_06020 [Candidatus Kariarchaeaceae archaeon]|jgi:hypothetical protein
MDHLVYLDKKAKEFDKIKAGSKSMILRGAAGRKMPYGRVNSSDILFFINNDGSGILLGTARVKNVINSDKMTKEESIRIVDLHMDELDLSKQQYKRWAGKRYLVLISFSDFEELETTKIDRSKYDTMDDWIPLESISEIIVK